MELRRALLLFAIVLGLAAVVTVLAGGSRDEPESARQAPAIRPARPTDAAAPDSAGGEPVSLRFTASGAPVRRSAVVGRPTVIRVSSDEAGDVQLRGLGLLGAVEPTVPARFDVLPDEPGRYDITFARAGQIDARSVGTLVVAAAR